MPNFMQRRSWARSLDQAAERLNGVNVPERGWIAAMRYALGMSADQVALRKGVSRNAVYQAERSELEGSISLKQMERLADAMGGKFVYAIVPNAPIDVLKHRQAVSNAKALSETDPQFPALSSGAQQDWLDDTVAEQLQNFTADFWA